MVPTKGEGNGGEGKGWERDRWWRGGRVGGEGKGEYASLALGGWTPLQNAAMKCFGDVFMIYPVVTIHQPVI